MSAESAHLSTFGAETEAGIWSTSTSNDSYLFLLAGFQHISKCNENYYYEEHSQVRSWAHLATEYARVIL